MSDALGDSAALSAKLGDELEGLFEGLARAGLQSGPRERIAAAALTASLVSTGVVRTLDELKPLLAPLLARSPDERRLFFQTLPHSPAPEPDGRNSPSREARPWIPAIFLGLLLVATALYFWLPPPGPLVKLIANVPPTIASSIPATEAKSEAGPRGTGFATLDRIATAAEHFEGAPTIEELGRAFALEHKLNWPAESYAIRLHEFSGLPRGQPLPLFAGQGLVWARLTLALDRIEQPGHERPLGELVAAAEQRVNDRRGAAYTLADQIPGWLDADPPQSGTELIDRIRRHAEGVDEFTIQRALAMTKTGRDPRVQAAFEGAPWLPRREVAAAPTWLRWIAVLLPLLVAVIWLGNSLALRKAFLRRRPPKIPPLQVELVAEAERKTASGVRQFRQIAQHLQRRTPRLTDRIDAEGTIAATIRSGGEIVMAVYREARDTPEYLVLIERNAAGDQDAMRLRDMIRRLERFHFIQIVVFYFSGEPSVLEPDRGGRAVPIERLRAQYPDHRLLILGAGADLLDPLSLAPRAATARLRQWSRRALLSPLPLAEWGRNEFALANALDMPIGRATPDGFFVLANLLGLDGAERDDRLDRSGDGLARPLPEILRLTPQRFLYGTPPTGLPVPELIQSLRNYLDGPAFEWLSALAVYPAVQWDLTLFLGVSMRQSWRDERSREPLYREDRIAALTQLPWLREGQMPNWLRRALIEQLQPDRATEIRALLNRLLKEADLKGDRASEDPIRFWIGREMPRDRLPPEELFEDEVLLDFLARGRIEDLALPGARWLDRIVPRGWRDRLGIPELAVAAIAIAYAFFAAMLAPKPSDGGLPTGAWLPLTTLAAGGLVALAVGNPGGAYRTARSVLVRACTPALAFAMLAAASAAQAGLPTALFQPGSFFLPLRAWLASQTMTDALLLALTTAAWFAADRVRDRLGIPRRQPHSRLVRIALPAAEILALTMLIDIVTSYAKAIGTHGLIPAALGAALFVAGWAAAHMLPERLPPPSTAPRQRRALWSYAGGTLRVALALLPILPALSVSHYVAASVQELGEIPGGISAMAELKVPDGNNRLAIGGMDGTIRLFRRNGTRYEKDSRATPIALKAPAMSLQLRRDASNHDILAVGCGDGTIHLFDVDVSLGPEKPSQLSDTDGATLPTRVALDPGGFLLAAVERVDGTTRLATADGHIDLTKDQGGAVTAMVSVGKRQFLVGTLDGRLHLVIAPLGEKPRLDESIHALRRLRLPGRARIMKFDEEDKTLLVIGDDGTLLHGQIDDMTDVPENRYRREQFALGEARPWKEARPANARAFRDCPDCPEMVEVPAGTFLMGSSEGEGLDIERPQHLVTFARPFAVGRFAVTLEEWDACVREKGGCNGYEPNDDGWGRGRQPVINVSWNDAKTYIDWLSRKTGQHYRLLSEAEWEYAARGGSTSAYAWGDEIGVGHANCAGCGSQWGGRQTAPVGSFAPNGFGLYDMHGNVWEWVEDCYMSSYKDAPADGSARLMSKCDGRVLRGGSWFDNLRSLRSAYRGRSSPDFRIDIIGFRVARTL